MYRAHCSGAAARASCVSVLVVIAVVRVGDGGVVGGGGVIVAAVFVVVDAGAVASLAYGKNNRRDNDGDDGWC